MSPHYCRCRYAVYTITPHSKAQAALLGPAAAAAAAQTYTYTKGILTDTSAEAEVVTEGDCVSLDNGLLQLNFSKSTGRLIRLTNHQAGVATNLTLDMAAYLSGKLLHASILLAEDWPWKLLCFSYQLLYRSLDV